MALRIDDRWLWLGLGVFTFFAIKGVAYGLREVVRLTEVSKQPPCPRKHTQLSEDAIKTESLETLATCSNVEIRKAATKILCDRFMKNSEAKQLLISDFNSPNPELQENALKALTLLDCHAVSGDWYSSSELADLPPRSAYLRALPVRGARARPHEESPEEQALRRRRREAMVLNEGDRPVSQDDIIQRGGRMTDDETRIAEQALATLARMERVRAAAQGDNST